MIPVTLPITLMLFVFLILAGITMLFLGVSNYITGFVRARAQSPMNLQKHAGESFADGAHGELAAMSLVAAAANSEPIPRVEGYRLPLFLQYHAGHSWAALKESGEATVGIDEFAGKLLGAAKVIASPRIGQRLRQGEQGWILRRKGKDLHVPVPLDGVVTQVNQNVFENPEVLASSPYGAGWLVVMKPTNLKENLGNLFSGETARQWLEKSAAELRSLFTGKLGLVYQDGGLPEDGMADFLSFTEWDELLTRLSAVRPVNVKQ